MSARGGHQPVIEGDHSDRFFELVSQLQTTSELHRVPGPERMPLEKHLGSRHDLTRQLNNDVPAEPGEGRSRA